MVKRETSATMAPNSQSLLRANTRYSSRTIETPDVLGVLKPIWTTKAETARRLRSRIERVLDYASAHGWREGDNPARWKGHLRDILPKRDKSKISNFAAMPYEKLPHFLSGLQRVNSLPAFALEFTILTAARTSETLGARWDEFDLEQSVWQIPATRMKAKQEHSVPLSDKVIAVLKKQHYIENQTMCFSERNWENL